MTYLLALSLLFNVLIVALGYWFVSDDRAQSQRELARKDSRHEQERIEWRKERDSHRRETAQLNQARMEETANLLQRIQAPEQAAASHAGATARPDPPPVNLEDDEALFEEHKRRMAGFYAGDLNG